jgi:hypothetical protein
MSEMKGRYVSLSQKEKCFIAGCYGLGFRYSRIAEEFASAFPGETIPPQGSAQRYNFNNPNFRLGAEASVMNGSVTDSQYAAELLKAFDEGRRRYEEDPYLDVPIARLGYRMTQYQELFDKARDAADKATSGPNPNYGRGQSLTRQCLEILKQAAEERGGLYTNRRTVDLSLQKMSDEDLKAAIFGQIFQGELVESSADDVRLALHAGGSGSSGNAD